MGQSNAVYIDPEVAYLYTGEILTRRSISTVRLTVHSRSVTNTELFVFLWTESILKAELFENDDVTVIT